MFSHRGMHLINKNEYFVANSIIRKTCIVCFACTENVDVSLQNECNKCARIFSSIILIFIPRGFFLYNPLAMLSQPFHSVATISIIQSLPHSSFFSRMLSFALALITGWRVASESIPSHLLLREKAEKRASERESERLRDKMSAS